MDTSQVLHRCMRQVQVLSRPTRCRDVLNTRRDIVRNQRQFQFIQHSSRAFTVSTRTLQDDSPRPRSVPQRSNTAADQETSEEKQPVRTAPRQPSSRPYNPNDVDRIDLSSLAGIPADYVAPKRSAEAETATAKLNALFKEQSRKTTPPTTSTSSSQSSSSSRSPDLDNAVDNAFYDAVSALEKPRPMPTTRFDQRDKKFMADIVPDRHEPLLRAFQIPDSPSVALRLRPTLGRTLPVGRDGRGVDLTRAFRMLDMKCNANGVKRDARNQRFHVRRGQRIKIERKARWRVLFREGFLEECARVRKMMRQGW